MRNSGWERSPLASRDINRFDNKVSRGMFDDSYGSYFPQKIGCFDEEFQSNPVGVILCEHFFVFNRVFRIPMDKLLTKQDLKTQSFPSSKQRVTPQNRSVCCLFFLYQFFKLISYCFLLASLCGQHLRI